MFRLLIVLCAVFGAMPALAQAPFPNRPIRFIVPFAPGGSNDFTARLMAPRMAASLGQPVVIETRSGAGGMTGVDVAAKAPADGYTVALGTTGAIVIGPSLSRTPPFVAERDLAPITLAINVQVPIVVPAQSPYRNLQELLAAAKAQPGKITFGSSGAGGMPHLAGELLNQVAGMQMVHVPYRGAGPALNDLVGGQTQFMITTLPSVTGLVQGGQLRALAVTSRKTIPQLPGIPAIAEAGYPDYESTAWYGFVVPKGVPAAVKERLSTAIAAAIRSDIIRGRLSDEGAAPIGNSAQEFATMMAQESARWKKVISASGFKLD